jgi:hypothetical protein
MRKVLSFVLVLSLVLGSFSMAFAATPAATSTGLSDIAGIVNEEAIQVNYDLGIVTGNPDGTFLPTKTVTRAEFAAMITRALAIPDSALAGYTSTSFKDTAGYSWAVPYLAFCQSKGIMLGDGAGNVMPGRTINMNEAITMALRAVGYTANSADLVGVWPANYVSVAQNNSMYDDVANTTNVDKANAAQIIYNALTVQKVSVNSDGETTKLTITDPDDSTEKVEANLLNTGLDCYGRDGIVDYEADSKITLTQYTGAYATIYKDDGGDGDIVAIKPISKFLTGKFLTGYAKFKADGVEYNYPKNASTIAGIVNCEVVTTGAVGTTAAGLAATDTSITLAVKTSGKTITDVYSLTGWVVSDDFQADADVQDEITDDQSLNGNDFALDDSDEIDMTKTQVYGVASLDKIVEDDVVYVYTFGKAANADIVKVAVGTETVSGKVTKKDGTDYTIAGKVYGMSDDAATGALTVGTDYDIVLDAYGEIYDADETSNSTDTYGVILATEAAGIDDARVKMYLSTDETKSFYVDEDEVTAPGTTGVAIGYGLSSDGKIDAIDDAITADNATMSGVKTLYVSKGAVTSKYAIASDAVVFTMDAAGDCDISSIGKVDLNETLKPATQNFSFILNDDDEVVAMVVNSNAASRDADDVYAVVNAITEVWNETDEETVNEIAALVDGAEIVKQATNDTIGDGTDGLGLIKITYDGDGFVKTATNAGITSSGAFVFDKLNTAKDSILGTNTNWYDVNADKLFVYEKTYDNNGDFDAYVKSTLSKISDAADVVVYDTDSDDGEEGYEVVIWTE